MRLARPVSWLSEQARRAEELWLELDELQLSGWARVQAIGEEVHERPGTGCLVTMTVQHVAREVLRLRLADGESVELTPPHRLYVEGRGWTAAADLAPGALLRSDYGPVTVESIEPAAPNQRVYNLEVSLDHTFRVGHARLWAHNQYTPAGAGGGTFRDSAGRLRNADGTFAFDGGPKRVTGGTHGNTAGSQEAVLYERYDAEGNFLKHGISQDPATRYTQAELNGGYLIRTQTGPRSEMLKIERNLVETSPGPLNKEPWAGSRKPQP